MSLATLGRVKLPGARAALVVGLVASAAAAYGAWVDPQQAIASYFWAYRLWLSCGLGALAILSLHFLAGGGWGVFARRPLEAAALTLPGLALAYLPIALNLPLLFPWARPEAASDAIMRHQAAYLNTPFAWTRAACYFAAWSLCAWQLVRVSSREDLASEPQRDALAAVAAPTLVVLLVTTFFAAVDWTVALEARWFSTAAGFILLSQSLVAGMVVAVATVVATRAVLHPRLRPQHLNDLGNLLLASLMIWAYLVYSELLVIWSGNLPADNAWYVHRGAQGWAWVGGAMVACGFALPFMALLVRAAKRHPRVLRAIAGLAFLGQAIGHFWQVTPAVYPAFHLHWLDLAMPLATGGLWSSLYATLLARRPLLPRHGEASELTPEHAYHAVS